MRHSGPSLPPYLVASNDPYVPRGLGDNAVLDKDLANIALAEIIMVERMMRHTQLAVGASGASSTTTKIRKCNHNHSLLISTQITYVT